MAGGKAGTVVKYGAGGYNEGGGGSGAAQQPMVDGMTMQPSVGRFTEKERRGNVSMFARKPATPVMSPLSNCLLPQDNSSSSQSSSSGVIVNLRAASRAEGKVSNATTLIQSSLSIIQSFHNVLLYVIISGQTDSMYHPSSACCCKMFVFHERESVSVLACHVFCIV